MSSSQSYTRAVPLNTVPSLPVILPTQPPGARLPRITCRWPVGLMGSASGRTISCWPGAEPKSGRSGRSARFSLIVLPVTVIWLSSIRPSLAKNFISAGVPPMPCSSSITKRPDGLRSQISGVLSLMSCHSSMVSSMSKARAMASRCSTALVLPPVTMISRMALSIDCLVTMSRGLRSSSSSRTAASPAATHSWCFSASSAGVHELYGRLRPMHSIALLMVLAVYMPPHAPAPGHDDSTICWRCSSVMVPASDWP